ncbi:hypothetical protein [Acidipila sp. EB88]|uniref:hypothetical protein n=1 Tax=Acidipila sp. EB88 TaxID=2305226 RepID=UPI000F5FC433|nr:hypothetical protein [Acidipila sp. EB88]RRA47156.1 hypothetical protein D1Y84_01485 [Acidipila sp. EB88]
MMPLDVLFGYAEHPTERCMLAINNLSEVYGIRAVRVDESARQVRVEFDATRLTRVIVQQLLRRTGLDITGEISLIPPQPAPKTDTQPEQPAVR